jgi:hypothetical protein
MSFEFPGFINHSPPFNVEAVAVVCIIIDLIFLNFYFSWIDYHIPFVKLLLQFQFDRS